jgi:hypothetical protein
MQLTGPTTSVSRKHIDSSELFLAITDKNIEQVVMHERGLTPTTAFGKPSLATYRKDNENLLYSNLETLLIRLSMSFNLGKNLESWQISEIATDVYQKYYFLSLEEFLLVLKKGRTGEFGKIYDRLDGAVIMEWFEKYETSDERQSLVKQRRIALEKLDRQENEEIFVNIFQHPQMQQLVQNLGKNRETTKDKTSDEDYQQFKAQYLKTRILNKQEVDKQDEQNMQSDFP